MSPAQGKLTIDCNFFGMVYIYTAENSCTNIAIFAISYLFQTLIFIPVSTLNCTKDPWFVPTSKDKDHVVAKKKKHITWKMINCNQRCTFPETNMASESQWLVQMKFLLGYFQGCLLLVWESVSQLQEPPPGVNCSIGFDLGSRVCCWCHRSLEC